MAVIVGSNISAYKSLRKEMLLRTVTFAALKGTWQVTQTLHFWTANMWLKQT